MDIASREPCGAEVTGVSLGALTAADVDELRGVLAAHGVVVLRDQEADDAAFLGLLRAFGRLTFTVGETPVDGFPDLNVISNVGRETPPRSVFHIDTSYVAAPPTYTALRAVAIPREGGQTLFSNQYRAFDLLAEDMRARLAGRTIRHVVNGVSPAALAGAETAAEHPVFRTHPISGRTSLYLSTPERCVSISGLGEDESRRTISFLYAHSTRPANVLRHTWAAGDVVIWDNGVVMHRADHDGVQGERVMHRGMVIA